MSTVEASNMHDEGSAGAFSMITLLRLLLLLSFDLTNVAAVRLRSRDLILPQCARKRATACDLQIKPTLFFGKSLSADMGKFG